MRSRWRTSFLETGMGWVGGSVGRWVGQSVGRWVRSVGRWVGPVCRSVGPVGRWVGGSVGRWSVGPVGRWVGGSGRSVGRYSPGALTLLTTDDWPFITTRGACDPAAGAWGG